MVKCNKLSIVIAFICIPKLSVCAALQEPHIALINQFFKNPHAIATIRSVIDDIEISKKDYPDYDGRRGSIWSDCWIEILDDQSLILAECKDTVKGSQAAEKFEQRNPESIFSYPAVHDIFSRELLPRTIAVIKENGWTNKFPRKLFAQLFVQRCHIGNRMDWHQDPGEDYANMADYSLVLMLSNQHDPQHGWNGGEFHIKPGLPHEKSEHQTIIHAENQGILFNNQLHSHSVSEVTSDRLQSKRDLIVAALYFDKPPMPLHAQDNALERYQAAVTAVNEP